MDTANWYTILAVTLISLASLGGASILIWGEKRVKILLPLMLNFAAGALLGDVFLHILPELLENGEDAIKIGQWLLIGVLIFFILEWRIKVHHSHEEDESGHNLLGARYLILFGDGLHNFIDGLIIAAAFQLDIAVGFATTLAVLFHEIPHELGDFAVLLHSGLKPTRALWLNLLSALTAIVGALVGIFVGNIGGTNIVLALAASSFLYIAMSDLLPEINRGQKHHKGFILSLTTLLLGVAIMAALLKLE